MLIQNLREIEAYLGRTEAVKTIDELIAQFGARAVHDALLAHDLELKMVPCRIYACLTDKARVN